MDFKELLKRCNIRGAHLARQLGVSRVVVSRWVTGKALPRTEYLPEIVEILNVSYEELFLSLKKQIDKERKKNEP